jgi:hypothetical protein
MLSALDRKMTRSHGPDNNVAVIMLKERCKLGEVGVVGRIILKCVLKTRTAIVWLKIWYRQRFCSPTVTQLTMSSETSSYHVSNAGVCPLWDLAYW